MLILQKNYLPIVVVLLLVIFNVQALKLCFTKQSKPLQTEKNNVSSNGKVNRLVQSELRSYHPHYLNSISYPHPMTPHIYYGQVVNNRPIFYIKDIELWNPNSIERFTINGYEFTDASAKYYLLRRQQEFRYMLVVQMQNSYQNAIDYSLQLYKRRDHYLVLCQFKQNFTAYLIYLTYADRIMKISELNDKGINIYIRNQSTGDARENWRLSQNLMWRGRNNILDMNSSKFTGAILELEYFDRNMKLKTHINLHQMDIGNQFTSEEFVAYHENINISDVVPKMTLNKKYTNCSVAAVQKIFDGLTYQFGTLKIKDGHLPISNSPKPLLSFCPSRKRFPWGFLWDDGFHCQVAVRKDPLLVIKVVKSWLDTMLQNGWIPREQNRGAERQHLCNCPRFMQKDIKDGNPPTLILALDYLKRTKQLNPTTFPQEYWNKVKLWYEWFLATQKEQGVFLFKWHDSINQMGASFTSGMDDFPRPTYSKAHIDLQSWMYFFTKFMIEASVIYSQSSNYYIQYLQLIKSNFKFFIELNTDLYKDIANDTSHSPHIGYPNILPVAFGVPEYKSEVYNATIKMVKEHLDTGAGLSSISMHSPQYLQNQDSYWRGPVWININYLFLRGLKLYYPQEKQLYSKLRSQLLDTVCGNWQKSGFFYQNYINGRGSFSYPFNGWTSLIAIISQQNY